MPAPVAGSGRFPSPRYRSGVLLLIAIVCIAMSGLLLTDRPGLEGEYFATSSGTEGRAVARMVGAPQLEGEESLQGLLVSSRLFTVRWRGWLVAEVSGEHGFTVRSSQPTIVRVAGQTVVDTREAGTRRRSGLVWLTPGAHPIEVIYVQESGRVRLMIDWSAAPAAPPRRLEGIALIARRPASLRAHLRRLLPLEPEVQLRIGALIGAMGLVVLGFVAHGWRPWRGQPGVGLARAVDRIGRREVAGSLLFLLFVATGLSVFPFTSPTGDGDDVRYMDAALFDKKMGWNMNRYVHIYSLKACLPLARGDIFLASRIHWSLMFAATVAALASAAGTRDRPGTRAFDLRAIVFALFLLLSQVQLFGGIGLAFADYSAMMFVMLGVAVCLHGFGGWRRSRSGFWQAMLLGALTVAAVKSKETGIILAWTGLVLLWRDGRVDWRCFGKRLSFWFAGAGLAYLGLMIVDAMVLDDFWFSLRPETLANARALNAAALEKSGLTRWAWLSVVWRNLPLRWLLLLVTVAALVAIVRRRRIAFGVVTLMPLAYLAMMIAVHPPIDSSRYLFPIVPVACLVGARFVADIDAASVWKGWPASLRTILLVAGLSALFGGALSQNRQSLAHHLARQRGELILYPWRQFETTIRDQRPRTIVVSSRLHRHYGMVGQRITRERIARLYFHRRHLQLRSASVLGPGADVAIGDRKDLDRLRRTEALGDGEVEWDRTRQIGLVRSR